MQNAQILKELMHILAEMDYFALYPSSRLSIYLKDATTDGDRVRIILRDPDVQEYIFPHWRSTKETIYNPVQHYIHLRKTGEIPAR